MKDLRRNQDPQTARAYADHLRALMEEAGLPYGRRKRIDNSRLAQELGAWADTQQVDGDFHDAMFRAYFADERNIGDTQTLVDIAGSVGLDTAAAKEVLETRAFSPRVTADWERAWESGITGVPTFTSRDLFVYGQQPYAVLERFYNHLVKLRDESPS